MNIAFFDTSALINVVNDSTGEFTGLEGYDKCGISFITLHELDKLKESKDSEISMKARKVIKVLYEEETSKLFKILPYKEHWYKSVFLQIPPWVIPQYSKSPDVQILGTALSVAAARKEDTIHFITSDISQFIMARNASNHLVETGFVAKMLEPPAPDDYCGYTYCDFRADFSEDDYLMEVNPINNHYIVVKNPETGGVVQAIHYRCGQDTKVPFIDLPTKLFGSVKPMSGDVYQRMLLHSLTTNKITMARGPAGSGKTYLALGSAIDKLEMGKIDRIVVFCNTLATMNSAKLGYYPGTKDEKLLDSQIGNLLSCKIGGRMELERYMSEEKIVLLPMSDIRGYDTSGIPSLVYISEAQNMDISLMKLALQRIGEDGYCIIDGDSKTQVDLASFSGKNNGMNRVSEVFRGSPIYGEVTLKNIYRSEIARIAEMM